ncbi:MULTISPECIES: FUSC family protein [unclassified Streptomyces]|uniref:FUSC family protein n=1 Tax=unclassified Streptomyces TaxID=2593676 RepID=UPI002259BF42|nr:MULTISPECIES: FUSC family protein [unclassified Streptomyces]WSP56114.1 FUSC family protein [Streptomyces sp. NBC_01241]WSU23188.1 FUSC family protein [Streptomyces sp. NBC_01108]MCX4796424.1 FUSC family protein [Streptomyces sp. NBC_01242]WSJ37656.1 FUSC family protein [Streptomyces sp. NBC_01321]WSP64057.1 FUSC family protein [Streptomyces sp. NBC_01240]
MTDTEAGPGRRRAAPPPWLLSGLRPQPATPIPWAAVVRASLALAGPLAVGFALDRPVYGALVSMGALSGVIGDTADAYRMRILNIAVPQLFGALGIMLGTLVFGTGWTAVAALTLVALVSGMMSTIGAVASVSGLLLLLNAVVGAGLPMPKPWWVAPLLLTVGGLFVLTMTLLAWPLRRKLPERVAVADTYLAVADLLAAAGTDSYEEQRHAVTQSLNTSYDLILARRARYHGRSNAMVRLLAQLNVVIPLVEAAPAVHVRRRPLPDEIPAAVRELAAAVEESRTGDAELTLPAPDSPATRAVDIALRHAAAVVHKADPDPYNVDDRLGRPAALGVRIRRTARDVLLSGPSWRYGLRLALCIGLAQALTSLIPVPRSYWVALTVTFVLKPDFGSVFSRAVLRSVGTAAGLVIAAPILAAVPIGWWDVPVMVVLAALIPAFTAKGYAFQTAAITPVILLLSDLLNHQGFHLVWPRFLDSLIGCAIVLVAGYLLWPESWHVRIGHRLADAVTDIADYVAYAFEPGGPGDRAERVRARRRIYRDLSVVRSEFQRALTEPPPVGSRAAAWWPLVVAVERIVDATTAARVRVDHGAPEPPAAEVAGIQQQLRELAEGIRASETLVGVRAELPGDEEGVLAPLRQEVAAARAIASPQP